MRLPTLTLPGPVALRLPVAGRPTQWQPDSDSEAGRRRGGRQLALRVSESSAAAALSSLPVSGRLRSPKARFNLKLPPVPGLRHSVAARPPPVAPAGPGLRASAAAS
jgi:hypothetical protein